MGGKKQNIVLLENLLMRGIHYEEVKEFEKSIFSGVYMQAIRMVEQIVSDNRIKSGRRGNLKRDRKVEIANAISFIGRRGTGKTSALLSFQEALKKYGNKSSYCEKENISFDEEADMEGVRFLCLDCIDTAVLEDSEDVFILVLANMLNQLEDGNMNRRNEIDAYERRSMIQKLEKIYNDFVTIKEFRQNAQDEYSAYEKMKNVASSQLVREEFAQFVEKYLRFMVSDDGGKVKESYLVITLDDLDMAYYGNQISGKRDKNRKSYEIMNSIYKYLSVPNVIVLSAYNHMNLHEQCIRAFEMENQKSNLMYKNERATLATQFMEKVFSPVYRLYMPSWRKRDYEEDRICIDIGKNKKETDIFTRYREIGDSYIFSVKKLLLAMYAEVTGVYYDMEGKKTHFLEPDSLRSLNNLIRLLYPSLIDEETDNICQYGTENEEIVFKKIKDDIYFRFIEEKLYLSDEKVLFRDWLEMPIDRRSEAIVSLVSPGILPLGLEKKLMIRKYEVEKRMALNAKKDGTEFEIAIQKLKNNSNVKYSYAELIHCIYHMTRENVYSRELVACILHSYSIYLSQIYFEYLNAKKKIEEADKAKTDGRGDGNDKYYINYYRYYKENKTENPVLGGTEESMEIVEADYKLLKGVIGETICGRWAEYYMPLVQTELVDGTVSTALVLGYAGKSKFRYTAKVVDDREILRIIREILFILTLQKNILDWKELTLEFRVEKNNPLSEVRISYEKESDFEITAFLKHSFMYQDFLRQAEQLLLRAVENAEAENEFAKRYKENFKGELKKFFDSQWKEYYEWDITYGNMMLPIHNFDLTYNLMKRMFQEGKAVNGIAIQINSEHTFCDEYGQMLSMFRKYLGRIDRDYCLQGTDNSFVNHFDKCPYIKLTDKVFEEEKSIQNFQNYINMIIEDRQNQLNYHIDPDD